MGGLPSGRTFFGNYLPIILSLTLSGGFNIIDSLDKIWFGRSAGRQVGQIKFMVQHRRDFSAAAAANRLMTPPTILCFLQ